MKGRKIYDIYIDGVRITSFGMAAELVGMKSITLYRRVVRSGGFYEKTINGFNVKIEEYKHEKVN